LSKTDLSSDKISLDKCPEIWYNGICSLRSGEKSSLAHLSSSFLTQFAARTHRKLAHSHTQSSRTRNSNSFLIQAAHASPQEVRSLTKGKLVSSLRATLVPHEGRVHPSPISLTQLSSSLTKDKYPARTSPTRLERGPPDLFTCAFRGWHLYISSSKFF